MNHQTLKDIKIGIIGGLIGFLLIVLPLLKFTEFIQKIKPIEKISGLYRAVIYRLYN